MARLAFPFALILLASPASAVPPEGETWRALETPSFSLLGNANPQQLAAVARSLESLKAVLARVGEGAAPADRSIPVVVFKNLATFEPYRGALGKGSENVVGYYTEGMGERFIALNVAGGGTDFPVVYHEYLHSVVRQKFGRVPLWFNEGLAGMYETFTCDGTEAVVGKASREHLRFLSEHPWMPVRELLAVGDAAKLHERDDAATAAFYAQSWLLVHDLFFGHPERRTQLASFLDAYARGTPHEQAFDGAFTGGIAGVEAELKEYLHGRLPYVTLTFESLAIPELEPARTVPRLEALLVLGRLLLASGSGSAREAARHFEAARALAPEDPRVGAGLGLVAHREGHKDKAEKLLEAAAAAGLEDPAALGVAARLAYLRDATPRARELAARALVGSPANADMLALYGLTYIEESGDTARGIASLERADQIEPDRKDVLAGLVALHARAGDRPKAEAAAARAEARGDPALAERAREALVMLDIDESDDAVEAGDYAKAIALLRAARDRTARAALRARLDDRILELEVASKKKPTKH